MSNEQTEALIARIKALPCVMVEICEPHSGNPSPNIIPVRKEALLAALALSLPAREVSGERAMREALQDLIGRVEQASDWCHNTQHWDDVQAPGESESLRDWVFSPALAALATTPAPREKLEADLVEAKKALRIALDHYDRNVCHHDDTHRGGILWTICDQCGSKWADDDGGFKPFEYPAEIEAAFATLNRLSGEG